MYNIVILGSGFAGLTAVKTLRQQGYQETITLVAPRPVLFYYPSLIWVPAGLRTESDLTVPLDKFFKRFQVSYHQGQVTGLDVQARQVHTNQGQVSFDALVIATGARFIKKLPGIEHIFIPCESFSAMQAYTERFIALENGTLTFGFSTNPNEPGALRGGPIFEFLFGIDTLLRKQKRRHKFELVFFSPTAEPGKRLGDKAVKALLAEMERREVHTSLGKKMKGFSEHTVHIEGQDLHSDLTLFMPGITGQTWITQAGLPLSEGGLLQADAHFKVPSTQGIYVAGDTGSYPGPDWLPKQAHLADLQAKTAAKNLLAERQGHPATHVFRSELICIVDTLDSGMLVYRDLKRTMLLPPFFFFNWAKRFFEWYYLRGYR